MKSESGESTATFDELVPLQLLQEAPDVEPGFLEALVLDAEVLLDVDGLVLVEQREHVSERGVFGDGVDGDLLGPADDHEAVSVLSEVGRVAGFGALDEEVGFCVSRGYWSSARTAAPGWPAARAAFGS
jgi:hypothetical protein